MKIVWFLSELEECDGEYTSVLASTRLRGTEIIKCLNGRPNVAVTIVPLQKHMELDPQFMSTFDVAVIGKIFRNFDPLFDFLKSAGVPMVFDMCDDIYEQGRDCYDGAFDFGVGIVASTPLLGDAIEKNTGRRCAVIPDLQDGIRIPPQMPDISENDINLLWYGRPLNFVGLEGALPKLVEKFPNRISIDLVTQLNERSLPHLTHSQALYEDVLKMTLIPWSLDEMIHRFSICDAVIIPSVDDQMYRVKTANRLMNTLWAGKPCIAHPLPSYTEFEEFVILEPDTSTGVQHLLDHDPEGLRDKIQRGQDFIATNHSPAAISERWLKELYDMIPDVPSIGS